MLNDNVIRRRIDPLYMNMESIYMLIEMIVIFPNL